MSENQKISVIIPVYNTEKYLAQAIQSVLKQEEKPLEVIVVDDGSTDNTKNILEKYDDSKIIKILLEKNFGIMIL